MRSRISLSSYYYWQHKLRIRFAPAQAPGTKKEEVPTLVPLSAAIPVQDSLIVQCGAFSLEVTEHTSERLLQKTLQLLQKVNA